MTAPGLKGTYEGSCAACLTGTDTGVGLYGEAEFMLAVYEALGIPPDQAQAMLTEATGCSPGLVPDGEFTIALSVCSACASKANMTVGLRASDVPCYRQRP